MTDELPLGLPPSTKRVRGPARPVEGVTWRKYAARERRLCDDCMENMPKVGGVPVYAINKAFYQRKSGTQVNYYCATHHQARLLEEQK